nr:phosphotransferase [Alteribacter salitolerans]
MVKSDPGKPDYLFRMGRTYSFLDDYSKARQTYKKALERNHLTSFSSLIEKIEDSFPYSSSSYTSHYSYVDGKNNFGAILHENAHHRYFTKISALTGKKNGAAREESFYMEVCSDFPELKALVPGFVNTRHLDGLSYLTIEMINATPSDKKHAQQVVRASHKLTRVSYNDIIRKYAPPRYVYQFKKGRAISVVHFFTQIHKESYNKKLFLSLHTIMKQHNYPEAVQQVITRLEKAIMANQLYRQMVPDEHYSLLHGDFAYQNVLINNEDSSPQIIDWTTYTVGPRFIDTARYVTSLRLPFEEVNSLYIQDKETGGSLSSVERVFFLYSLIVFYFQKFGQKDLETEISTTMLPALEELERLVLNINGEVKKMNKEADKNLKLKQLEHRIEVLEEVRRYMKKRLDDVLNSRSWRLTRPIRIFTEGFKKED